MRLAREEGTPILDVRSPKEYLKAHIPGAHNLPLFSDDARHDVGLLFKQEGEDAALLRGLELVGPQMVDFVREASKLSPSKRILVHCWRGGMRSQSLAWLWSTAGFEVWVLEGGYKSYRQFVLEDLARPLQLIMLGGKTGSGKTDLLYGLEKAGEQIIDLEGLAHHKGSAFGGIGQQAQPTVEQFENDLHHVLATLDVERRIWVENESHSIGNVFIPAGLWNQIQAAPVVEIEKDRAERVAGLVKEYACFPDAELALALNRIQKRLGGQSLKEALAALDTKNYETTAEIALTYYDKAYLHGQSRKQGSLRYSYSFSAKDLAEQAQELIHFCETEVHLHG